jgi:hypothetical protein
MERLCRNLQQGCSAGAQQQAIQEALVLIGEGGKLIGTVNTTCEYGTGSSSFDRSATHRLRALV